MADLAKQGLSIVVVEQFAHVVLGTATTASVMVNGRIIRTGSPAEINDQLAENYLGDAKPQARA